MLSWNQHQIQTFRQVGLRQPEGLAQQPFQPVAAHRVAVTFGNADTEPCEAEIVSRPEHEQETVAGSLPQFVHPLELFAAPNAPALQKSLVGHGRITGKKN